MPIGKEIKKLLNDKAHLIQIVKKGREKANIIAEENLKNIREKVDWYNINFHDTNWIYTNQIHSSFFQKSNFAIGTEEFQRAKSKTLNNKFVKELLEFKGVELVLLSKNFLSVKKPKKLGMNSNQ